MKLDPFEVHARIGQGAMGDVWRGEHRIEGVPVAVKFVTSLSAIEGDAERFRREVRSAAALNHPGIIRIFDYGEVDQEAAAQSGLRVRPGAPYLVMEYADGGSLAALESELSWSRLRELLIGLLEALGHAHSRGVIHRDLKPSNILLTDDSEGRRFKISDFGLAFVADEASDAGSSHNRAAGTPYFMAPEQFRSRWRDYGPWTDLYGLGCLTWRIVTGSYPFSGDALLEVAQKHLASPLPDFEPRVAVPDGFDRWLARLLEKHPYNRFRSAADALWPLLQTPKHLEGDDLEIELDESPTIHRTQATEPLESLADPDRETGSFAAPPDDDGLTAGDIDPVPQSIDPLDRELPPVPKQWSQERPAQLSMPMIGAGLELFNLREFPMVDRTSERDRLWEALIDVVQTGSTRLVLLEGAAGVGTSRLARWVRERAEQLGAAIGLCARHDRQGSNEGLAAMLVDHLALDGLDREEIEERLRSWYEARGVDREFEWRALASLVSEATDGSLADESAGDPAASDAGEVRAVIRRFLEYAARERPLVIQLDDLHWGLESLHFLEHLFTAGPTDETPILFVGTLRNDALAERPLEGRIVEALRELDRTSTVEVGDLNHTDQRFLVERFLRLTPTAAHEVVNRAGGNPQFAVELVRDWVDRDLLEVTDEGFDLREGVDAPVPDDLYAIWNDRIESILADTAEEERAALQLGAALGGELRESEWRDACARADLPFPAGLVERLLRHDLFESTDTGWRFAHNMLRETLERRAREAGRWRELNRHCAAALRDDADDLRTADRLADHLLEAGDREAALDPLLDAVEYWGRRGEFELASKRLETAGQTAHELDLDEDDRRTMLLHLKTGRLAMVQRGDFDRAQELYSSVLEQSEHLEMEEIEFEARLSMVALQVKRSEPTRALELGEKTLQKFRSDTRSELQLGRMRYQVGNAALMRGELNKANRLLSEAAEQFEGRDRREYLKCVQRRAEVDKHAENLESAARKSKHVVDEAESIGYLKILVDATNALADHARSSGNFERAADLYERAEASARLLSTPETHYVFFGRIQLALDRGKFAAARQYCTDFARRFSETILHNDYLLRVFAAHADTGLGDFSRVADRISELEELHGKVEFIAPDLARSLRRAAELALEADHSSLASRLATLAVDQERALNRKEKLEQLREKFEIAEGAGGP